MIRIAVLGGGRIARLYHLGILARLPGAEVAAVAEPEKSLRSAVARAAPGARLVSDYRETLADDSIDAVVVTLPSGLHAEAASAALAAGKDVYLEKPLATTPAAAVEVVRAWRASGQIAMLGFNQRFHPLVLRARELIRSGALGRVVAARLASGSPGREMPAWKRRRAEGGGALLDLGSHHVDLARFLFNEEVSEVSATTRSVRSEDDMAWMTLTMESGLTVESRASIVSVRENRFEVVGDAGRLIVDRIENRLDFEGIEPPWSRAARLRRELARWPRALGAAFSPLTDPSYARALAAFVEAVERGAPIAPDPADGERSLAVVLAAEAAAREGRRVRVRAPDA